MSYKTKEERNAWMQNYYHTHPKAYELHKARMRKRKRVYEKYKKEKCERCGKTEKRCVHHQDRNHHNNSPSNLVTLCRSCHMLEHKNDPQNLFYKVYKDEKK
jgi:late competence protein required for DNA uptake (superfamily II DNA/RNA helicase)